MTATSPGESCLVEPMISGPWAATARSATLQHTGDVDLLMDGLKASLIVTDPPYNVA